MKKINVMFKLMLVALAFVTMSCSKDLQDDVNDLKNRVTSLEESVDQLKAAIDAGKLITSVTAIDATSSTPAGWLITFSDNTTIKVYNGKDGAPGAPGTPGTPGIAGPQGPQGVPGQTPWTWINSAGNWATNQGSMPTDPNNAKYEIKVNGQPVKANGISMKVINVNGFVAFQQYDTVTNANVGEPVVTQVPFDGGNYISQIGISDYAYIFTIKGVAYELARPAIYPESITVIRDRDYVIKGGSASFNIAVNPSTNKVYGKENFELDYQSTYKSTRVEPGFIKIKSVEPLEGVVGHYKMTLEWSANNEVFAKDAAIFIVLNFSDAKGNAAKTISATPVIMNEEYKSITADNVFEINDIHMFTDETYTDSVRLFNYHQGYVASVAFDIAASAGDAPHVAIDPIERFTPDIYKYKVNPKPGTNTTIWPSKIYKRIVDAKCNVSDLGVPSVPSVPARPELGLPATPGIPAIAVKTITKNFKVHVYKVPANGILDSVNFKEYWIPIPSVNYKPETALATTFNNNGYNPTNWTFAIKSQEVKRNGDPSTMINNFDADVSKFDVANSFKLSYKLLPTINEGLYTINVVVIATPKSPRPTGLGAAQEREFTIVMKVKVVAPSFSIKIRGGHDLIKAGSNTYFTNKLVNVEIANIVDMESTANISKRTDVNPAVDPLAYATDPTSVHAQGAFFSPALIVTAPEAADYGNDMEIRKPVDIYVKLATGQQIPVKVICTTVAEPLMEVHSIGRFFVQFDRYNLKYVAAAQKKFVGNYSVMKVTPASGVGIDISSAGSNFTPQDINFRTIDMSMIKSVVYSTDYKLYCTTIMPEGMPERLLQIDAVTGLVTAVPNTTWENETAVVYQNFKVTYTDVWGNSAFATVAVYVKSNKVPTDLEIN